MKIEKKWRENLVKLKLTHLRQYFSPPNDHSLHSYKRINESSTRELYRNNIIPQRLNSTCHELKKSMKFLRECKLRNYEILFLKVFSYCSEPNLSTKLYNYNCKDLSNIIPNFDIVVVFSHKTLLPKHRRLQRNNNVYLTYFSKSNNLHTENNSRVLVNNTLKKFYVSLLRKALS